MDFGLSETQSLLGQSVRDFLHKQIPIERVREVMEGDSGHDSELLKSLAELGVGQVLVPVEYDGAGLGLLDAVVVAQELGRAAAPVSFHSAWVMAPLLVAVAGTGEQRSHWLPRIAHGKAFLTLVTGAPVAEDGRLAGAVPFVADASIADAFVVQAGSELHLLPREAGGIHVDPLQTIDGTRRVGEVVFDGVRVHEETRMPGAEAGSIERVLDAGRIALAADALGAAQKTLEMAVGYSLERQQFGRPIGSFQAVKHMCAETLAEVDPLQSLLWYAAYAWDEATPESRYLAPLLKSHTTEVATRATNTATQVYGGMGYTWECDLHIWFKRVGYDRQMLGGPAALRQRAASIQFP